MTARDLHHFRVERHTRPFGDSSEQWLPSLYCRGTYVNWRSQIRDQLARAHECHVDDVALQLARHDNVPGWVATGYVGDSIYVNVFLEPI